MSSAPSDRAMYPPVIRPYEPRDRDAVFEIAADTAFFGAPLESYLEDRHLFCDCLYRYYTDLEPEHGWVSCAGGGEVVGFLMGCTNTTVQRERWLREILPGVAMRLFRGNYRVGALTRRHLRRVALGGLQERVRVDTTHYPAHLHMNVRAEWRRQGLGQRLLEAFLAQLRALGVCGVHANTTSLNGAAGRLYERMGFTLFATCPSRQWSDVVSGPVYKASYVRSLQPAPRPCC